MQFRKPTTAAAVLSLLALAWQAQGGQEAKTAPSSTSQTSSSQTPEPPKTPGTSQATVNVGPADPAKGTAPASDGKKDSSIRVTVNEVIVPVTVTDEKGRFVSDLDQKDFQVFEENKPQTIRF